MSVPATTNEIGTEVLVFEFTAPYVAVVISKVAPEEMFTVSVPAVDALPGESVAVAIFVEPAVKLSEHNQVTDNVEIVAESTPNVSVASVPPAVIVPTERVVSEAPSEFVNERFTAEENDNVSTVAVTPLASVYSPTDVTVVSSVSSVAADADTEKAAAAMSVVIRSFEEFMICEKLIFPDDYPFA